MVFERAGGSSVQEEVFCPTDQLAAVAGYVQNVANLNKLMTARPTNEPELADEDTPKKDKQEKPKGAGKGKKDDTTI